MKPLFLSILLILGAETKMLTGLVIRVSDGDTITILTEDKEQIRIRLDGINAPEKGQDFGNKSREFVRDLCHGKIVRVECKGTDRYRRILGVVHVDSVNINEALLREGLAWHYKRYNKSLTLDSLEQVARKEKLNIWSVKNPIASWNWKKK